MLIALRAGFPFAQALEAAHFDVATRYPKVDALAARTAAAPTVAAYLSKSKTFYARHSSGGVL